MCHRLAGGVKEGVVVGLDIARCQVHAHAVVKVPGGVVMDEIVAAVVVEIDPSAPGIGVVVA